MPTLTKQQITIHKTSQLLTALRDSLYALELGEYRVACQDSVSQIRKTLCTLANEGADLEPKNS